MAKMIGLHQPPGLHEDISLQEVDEGQKLIKSLYIRDKHLAIARGHQVWLPTCDFTVSIPWKKENSDVEARLELAEIQEDTYRCVESTRSQQPSREEKIMRLSRLEKKLNHWAESHAVEKATSQSADSAGLALAHLATLLYIHQSYESLKTSLQGLMEARTSCRIFLQATMSQFSQEINEMRLESPPDDLLKLIATPPYDRSEDYNQQHATASLSRLCLMTNLSTLIPFVLAKNALGLTRNVPELFSPANEDTLLLQALRDWFLAADGNHSTKTFCRKIGTILTTLLGIVHENNVSESPNNWFHGLASPQYSNWSDQEAVTCSEFTSVFPFPSITDVTQATSWPSIQLPVSPLEAQNLQGEMEKIVGA